MKKSLKNGVILLLPSNNFWQNTSKKYNNTIRNVYNFNGTNELGLVLVQRKKQNRWKEFLSPSLLVTQIFIEMEKREISWNDLFE